MLGANSSTVAATAQKFVEKRRFQRVKVSLLGRFMLPNGQEYPCQVIDMSPGGCAMATPLEGRVGDHIIAYIDNIGRIEGRVVRNFPGGFAITIEASRHKREKLAAQLTWLANRHTLGLPEDRRHERIRPNNANHIIRLDDGRELACIVTDVSLSGAAIKCSELLEMGTLVTLGSFRGQIVRIFDGGVAVEFTPIQNMDRIAKEFF